MNNTIHVTQHRHLIPDSDNFGTVTENNAEILHFEFPDTIDGRDINTVFKKLIFINSDGKTTLNIGTDGTVKLSNMLTLREQATIIVELTAPNWKWLSYPYPIHFTDVPLDVPEIGKIFRDELAAVLHEINPSTDYSSYTWEELLEVVANLDGGAKDKLKTALETVKTTYGLTTEIDDTDVDSLITSMIQMFADMLGAIRSSFTINVGGDFTNKTFAEIIGTAQGEPTGDGVIGDDGEFHSTTVPYNDGEIYRLRAAIGYLADILTEETIELSGSYQTVNGSISTIEDEIDNIKSKIVDCLNSILDPDEPYTTDLTWGSIKDLVDNLPSDVEIIVTQSIAADSDNLRSQIDLTVDTIIEQYELTTQPVRGSWTNTVNNIYAVCAELAATRDDYEDLISGLEEIFRLTEVSDDE